MANFPSWFDEHLTEADAQSLYDEMNKNANARMTDFFKEIEWMKDDNEGWLSPCIYCIAGGFCEFSFKGKFDAYTMFKTIAKKIYDVPDSCFPKKLFKNHEYDVRIKLDEIRSGEQYLKVHVSFVSNVLQHCLGGAVFPGKDNWTYIVARHTHMMFHNLLDMLKVTFTAKHQAASLERSMNVAQREMKTLVKKEIKQESYQPRYTRQAARRDKKQETQVPVLPMPPQHGGNLLSPNMQDIKPYFLVPPPLIPPSGVNATRINPILRNMNGFIPIPQENFNMSMLAMLNNTFPFPNNLLSLNQQPVLMQPNNLNRFIPANLAPNRNWDMQPAPMQPNNSNRFIPANIAPNLILSQQPVPMQPNNSIHLIPANNARNLVQPPPVANLPTVNQQLLVMQQNARQANRNVVHRRAAPKKPNLPTQSDDSDIEWI